MGTDSNSKDFFISYTGVDVAWAQWIAEQLEAEGYTTVYQARDFHAGGNFPLQMDQAMRTAKRTIAVLSPEYLRSRYSAPEWAEAFRRDPTGEYGLLIPVRVKPCEVDGILSARVYIDLVGLNNEAASVRLVEQIRSVVSKPLPQMSPPPFQRTARTQAFISYSHADKKYLDQLHLHLVPFEQRGEVVFWDDTKISPGSNWREEIKKAIKSAKVAVLLISAAFLASEFITENEIPPLLVAAQEEGASILCVILSPCAISYTKLAQFQAVNPYSQPLIGMNKVKRETTWAQVAELVYKMLNTED